MGIRYTRYKEKSGPVPKRVGTHSGSVPARPLQSRYATGSAHQSWRGWAIQTECAALSAPVLPAGWLSRTSMDMDHPWEEKLPWEDGFA